MIWFRPLQICSIFLQGPWRRRKSEQAKDLRILLLRRQSAIIAGALSAADAEITAIQPFAESLKIEKHGLMQQLLTGPIRVQVDE